MYLPLAYIDPGSGSLLIQAAIAALVAIPFFFRQQIGKFVRAVRREPAAGADADRQAAEAREDSRNR